MPGNLDTLFYQQTHKKSLIKSFYRTIKFWQSVLWSDETKLDLFGPMDQGYVRHKKGKAYVNNTIPVKHGGGSVLLWGCFAAAGTGIMDSLKYQAILKKNVMPAVHELQTGNRRTFQHNNDPKVKSKSTKAWFRNCS